MSSGTVRNAGTSTQQPEEQLQLLQPVLAAQFWRFSANTLPKLSQCHMDPTKTITGEPILISKLGKPN